MKPNIEIIGSLQTTVLVVEGRRGTQSSREWHGIAVFTDLRPIFQKAFVEDCSLNLTLWLKIDQKPYMIWSLGPKTLKHESLEP